MLSMCVSLGGNRRTHEVREICRNKSAAAAQALIRIVEDVDQNGRNAEDGRVVVVASQTILHWAFGKPPDYDPPRRQVADGDQPRRGDHRGKAAAAGLAASGVGDGSCI